MPVGVYVVSSVTMIAASPPRSFESSIASAGRARLPATAPATTNAAVNATSATRAILRPDSGASGMDSYE